MSNMCESVRVDQDDPASRAERNRAKALALWNRGREAIPAPATPALAPAGPSNPAWLESMLSGVLAELRQLPPGQRNDGLNAGAYRVGRFVAGGHLDRARAEEQLLAAILATGLPSGEASATIRSALNAAADNPGHPPAPHVSGPNVTEVGDGQQLAIGDMPADVARELRRLQAREQARELHSAAKASAAQLPTLTNLGDFLAEPDDPTTYRVAGLWPTGGRVVLSAPHKAGKSTLVGNLSRCLVDGDDFLGRYEVTEARRVVLLDDELDPRMLRRWLREQRIGNAGRLELVSLRGRLSAFDILNPAGRTRWAEHLGAADVLILDCLRPVLDAFGLSEDKDAGRFLEAFDELLVEAGILEALVVHHTGHTGERSRGDSRIQDWPDAVWQLTRDRADADGTGQAARYFAAYGRDVDQPAALLGFTSEDRQLRIAGGSPGATAARRALGEVLQLLGDEPGLSGRQVWERLQHSGHARSVVFKALEIGADDGLIERRKGHRNAQLHYLNSASDPVRRECAGSLETSAPVPLIERGTHWDTHKPVSAPKPDGAMNCRACGQQLAAAVIFDGFDTCPTCVVLP